MIHHRLGSAFVLDEEGDPVPVDTATPRDRAESASDFADRDAMACMV